MQRFWCIEKYCDTLSIRRKYSYLRWWGVLTVQFIFTHWQNRREPNMCAIKIGVNYTIFLDLVCSLYVVTITIGVTYSFMISSISGFHISRPSMFSICSNHFNFGKLNVKNWIFFSLKIRVIIAPLVIWTTFSTNLWFGGYFFNYSIFTLRKENCKIWMLMIIIIFFFVLGLLRNT